MKLKKYLVETRFNPITYEIEADTWYPDFVGYLVAETENRLGIKRHWYSKIGWYPKNPNLTRVRAITNKEHESKTLL